MIVVMTRMITIITPHSHHGRRHLLSGSIGDAEDAAMIVIITAVSDAKDATMIVDSYHPRRHLSHHLIIT